MNTKAFSISLTRPKAFIFFAFVVVVTSACTQGNSTVTSHQPDGGSIAVPTALLSLSADSTLIAYIQVDDGERQQMTINGDNASIRLTGITEGDHTFTVVFEYTSNKTPDNPVMLVRARKTIDVGPGNNPLNILGSDYEARIFDEDGDGVSNLVEMLRGSNLFPDITVSTISGDTTEEGTTASFTVVLTREPADEVTVGISSSDATEGAVDNTSLTFSTVNWNMAQTITVTGVDDDIVDGNQRYAIILAAATSNDNSYSGFKPDDVTLTNINTDSRLSPSIKNVSIVDENAGSAVVGDSLIGNYTPVDADGTFTYQWLRNGTTIVEGAKALTYTLVAADSGQIITFEVTPVTATGVTVASRGITVDLDTTVLSLDFGIKQLRFNWPAVNNATYYRLMENADGVSDFTRRSTNIITTSNTLDIAVHRQDWRNVRYLLQACNSQSCSNSNEVDTLDGMLSAIGFVKASNTGAGDEFGTSVALSSDGNTLAVGARREMSNAKGISTDGTGEADDSTDQVGAVYIFSRSSGSWLQQAYIKASNAEDGDLFGDAVALSSDGNTLAVGARWEDSTATDISTDGTGEENNSGNEVGAVYIFSRSNGSWLQQAYVKASNAGGKDQFGDSVALSGDGGTLAVGAPLEDSNTRGISTDETSGKDNTASKAGAVYVFSLSGSNWFQQAYVKASNTGAQNEFGSSVALSDNGNTLVVGAREENSGARGVSTDGTGEDNDSETGSGAVYVFSRSTGNWLQQAYVKASNTGTGDKFGNSVALSSDGNTFAVGAFFEKSGISGISTDETGQDNNQNNNLVPEAGAVYVFSNNDGNWFQQAYVKASNPDTEDWFGGPAALALSSDGNTLAVGARQEGSNVTGISADRTGENDNSATQAGAVYVFGRNNGNWSQQTYVKAPDIVEDNLFGSSVALSGDGSTLVVGAKGEKSDTTGIVHNADGTSVNIDAPTSGAVYLY